MKKSLPTSGAGYWITFILAAALYFFTAKLGMLLATVQGNVTPLWPPAGIALAALLLGGRRYFPAVALGALAATAGTGAPWQFTLAAATGNTAAALIGLWLLNRRLDRSLERVRDVISLVLWGGLAACLVSATVGSAGLLWAGMIPWPRWASHWVTWWLGESMGVIVVTPVVLYWFARSVPAWGHSKPWEILCWVAVALLAFAALYGGLFAADPSHMLGFVAFPLLLWAALRFDRRFTATCALFVCYASAVATAIGVGPFAEHHFGGGLVLLWAYLGGAVVTSLALATATRQNHQATEKLSRNRDELAQTVERLRTLVEESPLGVAVISPKDEYLYTNPQFTRIFGYEQDEIPQGRKWFERAFPDAQYRREVVEAWRQDLAVSQVGQVRPRTFRVTSKNGAVKTIQFRPVTMSTGEQLVIYEDVSERENALKALRASEEKFQKLYMASPVWVNLTTLKEGRYLEVNEAFCQITGYSRQEALNTTSTGLGLWENPSDRETIRRLMQRDGHLRNHPVSFKMKDGQVRQFLWSAEMVKLGPEPLMISAHLDVTALRRAQEALRQSEEQYRLLIDNAQDAIYILQDGLFVFGNPGLERITGYTQEELRTLDFKHVVHPDHVREAAQRYADRLAGKPTPNDYPMRVLAKNGSVRWIQTSGILINWQGRPALLHISRDITRQRAMEVQLRQSQKMEAVGTLAGGIAHDFNNILAAIMGYAELSLEMTAPGGELAANLEQVLKAVERARGLVQQILSFSRGTERELEPLDLGQLVGETIKLLRAATPSNITIETHLGPCGLIRGDPIQLHQLLMNLITNAAQAMEETGGIIRLRLERKEMTPEQAARTQGLMPGPYVRLTLSDTGPGIPQNLRERVFEPFFTTKEAGKGSGLGLAAVHGIVQSHLGAITLLDLPGPGTVFQVLLPEAIGAKLDRDQPAPPANPTGNERLMLVDDEASLVEVGSHILRHLGYRVSAFTSSREALEAFKSDPQAFDLIITDQTMPGITGAALTQEIKALRPELPVIITTGFSHQLSAETAAKLGVAAFVMKPITSREIARAVHRALNKPDQPRPKATQTTC